MRKRKSKQRKPKRPMPPDLRSRVRSIRRKHFSTIRSYAEALIQLVRYRDDDGHNIGFDYGYIRDAVLMKFPTVRCNGPHKGRKTKMPYKELQEFACDLNRRGIRLPFRPRRRAPKRKMEKTN